MAWWENTKSEDRKMTEFSQAHQKNLTFLDLNQCFISWDLNSMVLRAQYQEKPPGAIWREAEGGTFSIVGHRVGHGSECDGVSGHKAVSITCRWGKLAIKTTVCWVFLQQNYQINSISKMRNAFLTCNANIPDWNHHSNWSIQFSFQKCTYNYLVFLLSNVVLKP